MIEHLQLVIAKMRREMFGPRSERSQRLLDQMELQLEELAAAHSEERCQVGGGRNCGSGLHAAQGDAAELSRPPARRRVVHPMPAICPCCGSDKLSKIGEDVTEPVGYLFRGMVVFAVRPELLSAGGTVHLLAELGVVFVLFDIGPRFSTAHVRHEAGDIFGFGSL
jgi:Transposase C of IS166 homeodomain